MAEMAAAALARETRRRWLQVRAATAPLDRARTEEAVRRAYQSAGFKPPERIVWVDGPMALQRDRLSARRIGPDIRHSIAERPLNDALDRIRDRLPLGRRATLESAVNFNAETHNTDVAINDVVESAVMRMRFGPRLWWHAMRWHVGQRGRAFASFIADTRGPHDRLAAIAVLDHYRRDQGLSAETEPAAALIALAAECGWLALHAKVCWACERQTRFATDALGRLHADDGPALAYADGTVGHFWKGLAAPASAIERPKEITVHTVSAEMNSRSRRILIDVMTPERFVRSGGAKRIAEDRTGILWRTSWNWNADAWAAVEVVNGTPEPDGHFRHYFLQVPPDMANPTEAVAWTYGMSARQYAQISQRT